MKKILVLIVAIAMIMIITACANEPEIEEIAPVPEFELVVDEETIEPEPEINELSQEEIERMFQTAIDFSVFDSFRVDVLHTVTSEDLDEEITTFSSTIVNDGVMNKVVRIESSLDEENFERWRGLSFNENTEEYQEALFVNLSELNMWVKTFDYIDSYENFDIHDYFRPNGNITFNEDENTFVINWTADEYFNDNQLDGNVTAYVIIDDDGFLTSADFEIVFDNGIAETVLITLYEINEHCDVEIPEDIMLNSLVIDGLVGEGNFSHELLNALIMELVENEDEVLINRLSVDNLDNIRIANTNNQTNANGNQNTGTDRNNQNTGNQNINVNHQIPPVTGTGPPGPGGFWWSWESCCHWRASTVMGASGPTQSHIDEFMRNNPCPWCGNDGTPSTAPPPQDPLCPTCNQRHSPVCIPPPPTPPEPTPPPHECHFPTMREICNQCGWCTFEDESLPDCINPRLFLINCEGCGASPP